jgi:hypothetical protein
MLTQTQLAILDARRNDPDPTNWLTHDEGDTRLDAMTTDARKSDGTESNATTDRPHRSAPGNIKSDT